MYRQIEVAARTQLLMLLSFSQNGRLSASMPTQVSRVSNTNPWVKKNLKIKPTAIPPIRLGKYNAPRKNFPPFVGKLKMLANSSAMAICTNEPTK